MLLKYLRGGFACPLVVRLVPEREQTAHTSSVPVCHLDGAEALVKELLHRFVEMYRGALEAMTFVWIHLEHNMVFMSENII